MKNAMGRWLAGALSALALGGALPTAAVEVVFKPVADGVYAYVGDIEGRTYENEGLNANIGLCLLYTSPSPRDRTRSRMPSSA